MQAVERSLVKNYVHMICNTIVISISPFAKTVTCGNAPCASFCVHDYICHAGVKSIVKTYH